MAAAAQKPTVFPLWRAFQQLGPDAQVCSALTDFSDADLRRLEEHDDQPTGSSFARYLRGLRAQADNAPHLKLRAWLQAALLSSNGLSDLDLDGPIVPAPRWPSGVREMDAAAGGFYGVTLLSGETGCGKSTMAFASALEAALSGIFTVYLNGELDPSTMRWFLRRYFGPNDADRREALSRLWIQNAGPGVSLTPFAMRTSLKIPAGTERMLLVVDSLNTIVQMSPNGDADYFGELNRWLLWIMEARRLSDGRIGAIVISELNKRGETVGAKGNYVADLLLYLKRSETDGYVDVEVRKGRYSGRHNLGALYLDHRTGRFKGEAQVPTPARVPAATPATPRYAEEML